MISEISFLWRHTLVLHLFFLLFFFQSLETVPESSQRYFPKAKSVQILSFLKTGIQ